MIMRPYSDTMEKMEEQFIAHRLLNIVEGVRKNPNLPRYSQVGLQDVIQSAKAEFRNYMYKAVTGLVDDPQFPTEKAENPIINPTHHVRPNSGGIMTNTPPAGGQDRPVTEDAVATGKWVLVDHGGKVVAMTVREAFGLGLQELKEWK